MRASRRGGLFALVVLLLGVGLTAHVRLRNPATGKQLAWPQPSVPLVIQLDGSDDVGDRSDEAAIRLALEDWNGLEGSALRFVEDLDETQRARRDWEDTKLHTVLFDEDGSSGFFLSGGIVAITSVSYFGDGRIVDADVLFNGRDHRFTTSGEFGAYDVQAVAAHELGHVAGLDHSGWAGSTMYPYLAPNDPIVRSLSEDELGGMRAVYPAEAYGTITGTVQRALDGSTVAGAHVTALDEEGRPRRAVLAGANGRFVLSGLDAGRYTLNVAPLDGPVGEANLSGGQTLDVDFEASLGLGPIDVPAGGSAGMGVVTVDAEGDVVLGRSTDALPIRLVPGTTAGATLRGTGLDDGSTLTTSDPDLTVENVTWYGGSVTFRIDVPAGEAPGHVDLVATSPSGDVSVLSAAIELTPADPTVTSVTPTAVGTTGGTTLVLKGTGFREGCRVVIGDAIYREGLTGGCQLLDDQTLTLTTRATVEGTHDVVVLDRTGFEGRLDDALLVDGRPVVATVFPPAGHTGGGTRVRLTGAGFDSSVRVLLDGEEQGGLQVFDPTRLEFVTGAGPLGEVELSVVDAEGRASTASFTWTATEDPELLLVDPGQGSRDGGETIELAGTNLDPACRVYFDVDPDSGAGGREAEIVEGGDGSTLMVVTPGLSSTGLVAVSIVDPLTGQASVLNGGFLVQDDDRSGGGGCATVGAPPRGPRAALESGGWMLALLLVVLARSLHARPARDAVAVA